MIPSNDDRCREFAIANHLIKGEAKLIANTKADPADAGVQQFTQLRLGVGGSGSSHADAIMCNTVAQPRAK